MGPSPRTQLVASVLVALALLVAPPEAEAKKGKKPAAKKPAEAPEKARAEKLFKEARAAYDVGKFEEALPLLEEAYELFPSPVIQFNLAQVHRKLGNWESSRYLYQRYAEYLREKIAAGEDVEKFEAKLTAVETTITEIEETIRKEEEAAAAKLVAESAPATAPAPVKEKKPVNPKVFIIGGAALGGAAVIATVIVLAVVQPGYVSLRPTELGDQAFEF